MCRVRVSRGAASRAGRVGQLSRGGHVAWTLVVVAGGGVGVRVGGAGIMAFVLRKCGFCVYVLCLLYAYNIVLCCVCSTVFIGYSGIAYQVRSVWGCRAAGCVCTHACRGTGVVPCCGGRCVDARVSVRDVQVWVWVCHMCVRCVRCAQVLCYQSWLSVCYQDSRSWLSYVLPVTVLSRVSLDCAPLFSPCAACLAVACLLHGVCCVWECALWGQL